MLAINARGTPDFVEERKTALERLTIGRSFQLVSPSLQDNIYLVPVECYDTTNTTNYWAEPLTGLEILVNVVNQTVFRFIDAGVQPIPPSANTDFRAAVTGIQVPHCASFFSQSLWSLVYSSNISRRRALFTFPKLHLV